MSQTHHTTKQRYTHLSETERTTIEILLQEGYSQTDIAKRLNRSKSTISREIKRGSIIQRKNVNSYDIIEVKQYYSDTAQILASKRQQHSIKRSILPKLPKTFLTELCEAMKQTYRIHSIDTFIHYYKTEHNDCIIPCTKTIYNWIHHGIISLKPIDLPRMVRLRKPSKLRNNTHKKILGTSIEERPEHINTRETFGHWEIDLIIGKQSKDEPVMLTLIERQTRYLIIKKLKHKTAQCVNNALKQIFKQYGKRYFRSITSDNGSEFSRLTELEGMHTRIYFAHPYSAYERGTNENHNGLLREFLRKGTSFKTISFKDIACIANALNNRPRRLLGYATPLNNFQLACWYAS